MATQTMAQSYECNVRYTLMNNKYDSSYRLELWCL